MKKISNRKEQKETKTVQLNKRFNNAVKEETIHQFNQFIETLELNSLLGNFDPQIEKVIKVYDKMEFGELTLKKDTLIDSLALHKDLIVKINWFEDRLDSSMTCNQFHDDSIVIIQTIHRMVFHEFKTMAERYTLAGTIRQDSEYYRTKLSTWKEEQNNIWVNIHPKIRKAIMNLPLELIQSIDGNVQSSRERCFLFIQSMGGEKLWKYRNMPSRDLRKKDDKYKKIIEVLSMKIDGNAIIECNGTYSPGRFPLGYRIADYELLKGGRRNYRLKNLNSKKRVIHRWIIYSDKCHSMVLESNYFKRMGYGYKNDVVFKEHIRSIEAKIKKDEVSKVILDKNHFQNLIKRAG